MMYIRSGVESGAKLEFGATRLGSRGFYVQPTVFSNVQVPICHSIRLSNENHPERSPAKSADVSFILSLQDDMLIARDEIFGPVQSILKYKYEFWEVAYHSEHIRCLAYSLSLVLHAHLSI